MGNMEILVGKSNGHRTIPFGELQETWAVIRGDAIFLLFSVCSADWIYVAGRGGERRGLGPRNDVFTTCKAITLHDGQQIIAAFFHSKYF